MDEKKNKKRRQSKERAERMKMVDISVI